MRCFTHFTASLCSTTRCRVEGLVLGRSDSYLSARIGMRLCSILDMDFAEFPFYEVG